MASNFEINKFSPQYLENENLRQRLDYLENLVSAGEHFESTRSLVDLKSFIKDAYGKFNEIIDEVYKAKQGYEYEKLKCQYLEKKLLTQQENKIPTEENLQENELKLKKVKELEEKVENLNKEVEEQKQKTDKYQKMVNKKDFFREYDYMCKEVEGLRKQNYNLTEMIKRIQAQQNPEENEEESETYK